jgi:SHS2 domain-containing protein
MPNFYENLPHTADAAVRVRGESWEDLLEKSARAFYDVMTDERRVGPGTEERTVAVEGADHEEVLVAWLGEFLYFYEVHRLLFGGIAFEEATGERVRARLQGEAFDPERHEIKTEIKAVTYHGLSVRQEEGEWVAEVVFDL